MINGYLVIIPESQDTELRQFVKKLFGEKESLNIYYLKDRLKERFGCDPIEVLNPYFVDTFGIEKVARAYRSRIYEVKDDLVYRVRN